MDKFLRNVTTLARMDLFAGLVVLMVFLGYLGFTNSRSDRALSTPVASPAMQK
ncbi:MAG: hypothetical protein H7126_10630 [Candidatus Parcubacteria bacterium]|nr:hypothetical protein [Leptolyngbyaceae cyanobacterium LF-bin-113]